VLASVEVASTFKTRLRGLLGRDGFEGALLLLFCARDLIVFYVGFEAMLIPLYFLLGVWGGENRGRATLKFIIYTSVGTLLMLIGILTLGLGVAGGPSFSYSDVAGSNEDWIFLTFVLAFFIKCPVWPFHGWVPDAYRTATPEVAAEADALAARLARRVGEEAIGAGVEGLALVLVPDPEAPARPARLRSAAEGRPAALGPAVPLVRASVSVRRAVATHGLLVRGRLGAVAFARAEEHLPALVIAADPALGAELAEQRLAPLAGLPAGPRARLTETLRAWLDRPGQVQAVAAELGVHPQTVRYRIRQLRDLFGERLEDPEARFELGLALRAG